MTIARLRTRAMSEHTYHRQNGPSIFICNAARPSGTRRGCRHTDLSGGRLAQRGLLTPSRRRRATVPATHPQSASLSPTVTASSPRRQRAPSSGTSQARANEIGRAGLCRL
jgi:hypothetical protein